MNHINVYSASPQPGDNEPERIGSKLAETILKKIPELNPVAAPYFNFTVPEPMGVVGIVCPDEMPLLAPISQLAAIIVAGNTCVVLASEKFPLATATLLFVSQSSGGLGRGESLKVGNRELTPQEPEPPKFRAFDKTTGELVWEFELPLGPAASPMTYSYGGRQYIVMTIGGGLDAELIALALPR